MDTLPAILRNGRRGFSLVELLVVIAIMAILLALAVPAFRSVGEANSITSAAALVTSEIDLARQTALAQNTEVELRFLPLPDSRGNLDNYFRGLQIVRVSDGVAYDKIQRLPSPIVILNGPLDGTSAAYSTLFAAPTTTGNPGTGTKKLPSGQNVTYRSVDFVASGSTTLNTSPGGNDTWFLTLKSQNAPTAPGLPAKNFITVQLDPITGRTRIFQP